MNNIKKINTDSNKLLQRLLLIDKPVSSLWYLGSVPELKPAVAVVGSRKPTSYGRLVSARLVHELAVAGVTIISGLALGHDALAHKEALAAGGTTIAVIGNGLANIHPHTNQPLAQRIIASGGTILSEYPPQQPVKGYQFLERNRLISGLADIVIVIEAGDRSGTLNTASHALNQGKDVMVVPGNITSPMSVGCNRLISQGATPLLSAADVIERLGLKKTKSKAKSGQINFNSPAAQVVYDLIRSGESDGEIIEQKSQLDISAVTMALTMLELNGYIKSLGANKWTAI